MFTPYIGVGYNSSTTSFYVEDKYSITNAANGVTAYIPVEALTKFEGYTPSLSGISNITISF